MATIRTVDNLLLKDPNSDFTLNTGPVIATPTDDKALKLEQAKLYADGPATNATERAQKLDSLSKAINPYYGSSVYDVSVTPWSEARKYVDEKYGYIPNMDNDDFYGKLEPWYKTLGKAVPRLAGYTVSKVGQSVGFLGSLINPSTWMDPDGVIASASDNAFSNLFEEMDDKMKNEWGLTKTFQEAEDREKGFFARAFTDGDFWTEDVVDGAAFMASAWVPGLALSKLGMGLKLMNGVSKIGSLGWEAAATGVETVGAGVNYFTKAQKLASGFDKFVSWSTATAGEAMFEAAGVKKSVYDSLTKDEYGNTVYKDNGELYTEDEKKKIAGGAAHNTFIMNAGLLAVTNMFELPFVTKLFGKAEGAVENIIKPKNFLDDVVEKSAAKTKLGKIVEGRFGESLKTFGGGLIREGYVEENFQLGIQRINEQYGAQGKVYEMTDLSTYGAYADQLLKQTKDAYQGNDIEASTSIGLGGLLGGGFNVLSSLGDYKKNKLRTEEAINFYNKSKENFLKFGNIYKTETIDGVDGNGKPVKTERILFENGEPVVDEDKLNGVVTGLNSNLKLVEGSGVMANEINRRFARDTAFSEFVQAHINAGMEDGLAKKLDDLHKASPEDLAKLGFVKDGSFETEINRYKKLASTIVKQNKAILNDIIFGEGDTEKARKNFLIEIGNSQAVLRAALTDHNNNLEGLKSDYFDSSASSLSDSLVEQLNTIQFKKESQQEFIDSLDPEKNAAQIKLAKDVLKNIEKEEATLLKNNPESLKTVKRNADGTYSYEKDSKNDIANQIALNNKLKVQAELENSIHNQGKKWFHIADFKNGKTNFLDYFDETVTNPVNETIEEDNKIIDEEIAKKEEETPIPPFKDLDTFLKEEYEKVRKANEANGQVTLPYEDWLNGAGKYVKNRYYKIYKIENPDKKKKQSEDEEPFIDEQTDQNIDEEEFQDLDDIFGPDPAASKKPTVPPPPAKTLSEDELPRIGEFFGTKPMTDEEVSDLNKQFKELKSKISKLPNDVLNALYALKDPNNIPYIINDTILSIARGNFSKNLDGSWKYPELKDATIAALDDFDNKEIEIIPDDKSGDFQDFEQEIDKLKNKSRNDNDKAQESFMVGIVQTSPHNSLANTTDEVEEKELSNGKFTYVRKNVNTNYQFHIATPRFLPGEGVRFEVITKDLDKMVNRLTGKPYNYDEIFNEDGTVKESMFDEAPIAVFGMVEDANGNLVEKQIGTIHEPQWIEKVNRGEYPHIVVPEDEKNETYPPTVEKEVRQNRLLRKELITNFNNNLNNPNFVQMGTVTEKSLGVLRSTDKTGLIIERVNPKIAEGGVENPHGYFGIVRGGKIRSSRNYSPDNIAETESFSDENIMNYEGIGVLMVPTPTGKMFPTFIEIPTLTLEKSKFIIEAWKAFTGQINNEALIDAVYGALKLNRSGRKPAMSILKSYINQYYTYLDSNPISKMGNGTDLKEGDARMDIDDKNRLVFQIFKDGVFFNTIEKPIGKAIDLPANILELMTNLKTTLNFDDQKFSNITGINNKQKVKFLSVKNDVLVTDEMTYNEHLMKNAKTYIDKGVESKNQNNDWVYFANPVIKLEVLPGETLSDTEMLERLEKTRQPENVENLEETKTEQVYTTPAEVEAIPQETRAQKLLKYLEAQALTDEQVEQKKEDCGGSEYVDINSIM
jgi:hypothetical protein